MSLLQVFQSLFTSAPRLLPADAGPRVRSGAAVVVDVREPREWTGGVAQGAALLPLSDLTGSRTKWQPFLEANAGKELLVYCAAGGRSGIAARILVREGRNAFNTGSLSDWAASRWPIVTPKRSQS